MNRSQDAGRTPGNGSALVWLSGVAAAGALLWLFRGLLLPLLLAALGAYFANPLVARWEERGVRRGIAVALLFVVATLAFGGLVVALAPAAQRQAAGLIEELPRFAERLEGVVVSARQSLAARLPSIADQLPEPAPGWPERLLADQNRHAAALASGFGTVLFVLLLAPVFGFFLLRDGGRLLDGLVRLLPARHIETTVAIWCEIDRIIGRYLRGLVLESFGVALLAAFGLALLGVPAPLVLGAITGLVNPLPYVGVLLSLAIALATALGAGLGAQTLIGVVLLYVGIRLIDDFLLVPLALGSAVHLHPALVIAAILAGEQTLGVLGMVLAVPLVTVLKEVARLLLESLRRGRAGLVPPAGATATPDYVC